MPNKYKNRFAQMTIYDELAEELNMENFERLLSIYLNDIYDSRVKFLKRQSGKGMADILEALDTHMTDRTTHMNQSANVIEIMAEQLKLNSRLARNGMRGHDSGHPFGSHEGEQALNIIGTLLNAGFFHHNAKGVDVQLSEGIIDKIVEAALKSIKEPEKAKKIKEDPDIMQRLEDDAWYFLEFIVGHDGEASKQDIKNIGKDKKKFQNIKESVLYYTSRANRTNKYKAEVQTLEAVLAKPADVISYLKSDMENAFRKGIIKKFSDEYLECIGELLFEKNGEKYSKEERIKKAREYIKKIEKDNLRETKKDVYNKAGKRTLDTAMSIIDDLNNKGIYTYDIENENFTKKYIDIFITKKIEEYEKERIKEGCDYNTLQAEKNKVKDYLHKMLKIRKSVVEQVEEDIKQELISDYCTHTQKEFDRIENDPNIPEKSKKEEMMRAMNFSPRVFDIMYRGNGLKNLNYKEYVQYTKREFQTHSLPKAVFETIKLCSNALVRLGVIRDKFYDPSVLEMIKDEDVKKAMKMEEIPESKYEKYRKKIGINEFNSHIKPKVFNKPKRFTGKKVLKRYALYKDVYAYTQRQTERFARTCEDVYYAIPNTINDLVRKALDSEYEPNQYLGNEEKKKVFEIRKELTETFSEYGGVAITKENLEKYINEKTNKERTENFAKNVASEIAIKYIGGFGNRAIEALLINIGVLKRRVYQKQNVPAKGENKSVNRLIKMLEDNDNDNDNSNNTKEEQKRIKKQFKRNKGVLQEYYEGNECLER